MSALEVKNARIESTSLGFEDHGFLTAMIHLSFGGSGQGFGGYGLGYRRPFEGRPQDIVQCGLFVRRVLEVVGVDEWEKLVGRPVRVRGDDGRLQALGHYLDDRWFDPRAEFEALAAVSS